MNQLNLILDNELCANLLSALLHSLWQGLVIGGILFVYLRFKAAQDANKRYTASVVALFSMLVCLLFTWSILNYEPAPTSQDTAATQSSEQINTVAAQPRNNSAQVNPPGMQNISTSFNWKPPVIGLWLTGVMIMLFRAIYIIAGGAKLQIQCKTLEDEHILGIIEQLRKSLRITRKIRVAVSEHITVPGVIGFFKPMLLLPVSMITNVPTEALQGILAHELAHIRRYDYLVNFCQMVIEAILFFNPAVWWISRQIRIEREVCCDNAGIASIGRRIRYAEVLIGWAQKMKESDIEFASAAIGFGKQSDTGGMLERIKRIVSTDHRPRLKVSWHIAAITLVLSIVILAALWQGTNMTVAFAGNLLTPQERIDKISEITKEYAFEERKYGPEDEIKVSGTVRTFDGKPLPADTYVRAESERPGYGGTYGIGISKNDPLSDTGTFEGSIEYGRFCISAMSADYAPVFAGPFSTEPGGSMDNIELVLEKGFEAKVKIVDKDGNPVKGAEIRGGFTYPDSRSWSSNIYQVTDANGIAVIDHAINRETSFSIGADGFEAEQFKGNVLNPDRAVT
ncbi:MAG: M56 family metallopeptidase [Sedimentisphaerales bacterium]